MQLHYGDVIKSAMTSHITSLTIVYSTVYSGADHRKQQSRLPVNSPHKGTVTQKMFPFDDVIMQLPSSMFLFYNMVYLSQERWW